MDARSTTFVVASGRSAPEHHRRGRHLHERPLAPGKEHAAVISGLHRTSLGHEGAGFGEGQEAARCGVPEHHAVALVFTGDLVERDLRADPDAPFLRSDERGLLGRRLVLLPNHFEPGRRQAKGPIEFA